MSLPLKLSNAQDAITLKLIDKNVMSQFQDQKYLIEGDKFLNISIMLRRKFSPLLIFLSYTPWLENFCTILEKAKTDSFVSGVTLQ